jgi:hypothetical protein
VCARLCADCCHDILWDRLTSHSCFMFAAIWMASARHGNNTVVANASPSPSRLCGPPIHEHPLASRLGHRYRTGAGSLRPGGGHRLVPLRRPPMLKTKLKTKTPAPAHARTLCCLSESLRGRGEGVKEAAWMNMLHTYCSAPHPDVRCPNFYISRGRILKLWTRSLVAEIQKCSSFERRAPRPPKLRWRQTASL